MCASVYLHIYLSCYSISQDSFPSKAPQGSIVTDRRAARNKAGQWYKCNRSGIIDHEHRNRWSGKLIVGTHGSHYLAIYAEIERESFGWNDKWFGSMVMMNVVIVYFSG